MEAAKTSSPSWSFEDHSDKPASASCASGKEWFLLDDLMPLELTEVGVRTVLRDTLAREVERNSAAAPTTKRSLHDRHGRDLP
jgi:hypothetical protein